MSIKNTLRILLIGLIGLASITIVILASSTYLDSQKSKIKIVSSEECKGISATKHQAKIQKDKVNPKNTVGKLCDTLTITNLDPQTREITFGKHDDHIEYDGVTKEPVESGKSLTVTLNKTGNYIFHDHDDETVGGTFTVTE